MTNSRSRQIATSAGEVKRRATRAKESADLASRLWDIWIRSSVGRVSRVAGRVMSANQSARLHLRDILLKFEFDL